jgi:hypothetical protein
MVAIRTTTRLTRSKALAGAGGLRTGPVVVVLADSWDRYFSSLWMQRLVIDGLTQTGGDTDQDRGSSTYLRTPKR